MACIDKAYTKSYTDYIKYREWARNENKFHKKYHHRISDYFYDWKENDFNGEELPITNTPIFVDVYLIRNCPFGFVQDRLNEMYGEDYNLIKKGISEYDTFSRNGLGKDIHFSVKYGSLGRHHNSPYNSKYWHVQIDNLEYSYNDVTDEWVHYLELKPYNSNTATVKTLKSLFRKIRKWNLPEGICLNVRGKYVGERLFITTKI